MHTGSGAKDSRISKSDTGRVRFPVSGFSAYLPEPLQDFFSGETVNTAFITEIKIK